MIKEDKMYELVIFDVDGTMIDTEDAVIEAYQKVICEEFGRYFTPEELSMAYGIPTELAMERLGFKDIGSACRRYYEYLFEGYGRANPFPEIVEVLEELERRKIVCGIVTSRNNSEVENDPCLQGLLKYFQYVICTEDTEKHKPDPEPALELLKRAGADTSQAIYLGDTFYDYMCAKSAGVKFALASWGVRNADGIEPDYVLTRPKDLLELVRE